MQKKEIGESGEIYCANRLQEQGYIILKQNFHSRYGEIDIIARHKHSLVFIEVKTRTKETIDQAQLSITFSKQKKLTKTAMYFLKDFETTEDILEYRFDVIIVIKKEKKPIYMKHFVNAFPPAEVGDFFA